MMGRDKYNLFLGERGKKGTQRWDVVDTCEYIDIDIDIDICIYIYRAYMYLTITATY